MTDLSPALIASSDDTLNTGLEDWGPRAGADSGTPMTSGRVIYDGDGVQVGVWECTPGGWAIVSRADHETVRIMRGQARLTDEGGRFVVVGPGDVVTLPRGWSGRWDVLETVRKFYVLVK